MHSNYNWSYDKAFGPFVYSFKNFNNSLYELIRIVLKIFINKDKNILILSFKTRFTISSFNHILFRRHEMNIFVFVLV